MTDPAEPAIDAPVSVDHSDKAYIAYARHLLAVRDIDTAQRSAVRRAIRPETESIAIPYVAKALDSLQPRQRTGAMRAYGMIASFTSIGHAPCRGVDGTWTNQRFGMRLASAFDRNEAIGVRLMMLPGLDVETAAEVIAGVLARLDHHHDASIDWVNVVKLLARWDPASEEARQPAFDFYAY